MYAVVKTGGKQYRVSPGDVFIVERLTADAGAQLKLDQVLMMGGEGQSLQIGAPVLGNTTVTCEVLDQNRADKVIIFKKKRRTGYKRTKGHRQLQTVLRVLDINGLGAVAPISKAAEPVEAPVKKTRARAKKASAE
ncbi:MAG: rplU [Rhodospirillales bacterium]|jgi:large subunit ribosomal protein L21|nr:rplU [Rhodospirillales bacterium]